MELNAKAQPFFSFESAKENLLFDVLEKVFENENMSKKSSKLAQPISCAQRSFGQ